MVASKHRVIGTIAAASVVLIAFHVVGAFVFDGYRLDLGALDILTPRYAVFVGMWTLFGGLGGLLLTIALTNYLKTSRGAIAARWLAGPVDSRFLVFACTAAVLLPLSLRVWLLHGAPLTDDESAYQFSAALLSTGRLWVPSPPLKTFFDQNFVINDGRMLPAYFLGWPAILALAQLAKTSSLANPVLCALTVPPLARLLQRCVGNEFGRTGILLFLAAPMLQVGAATLLSHTACLMCLTWCLYFFIRTRDVGSSWVDHAGFSLFTSMAFWVRPQSAICVALPLICAWMWELRGSPRRVAIRLAGAFLVPAVFLGSLFLAVLWAQNGSPWIVGYAHYNRYITDNAFRFTSFSNADLTALVGFQFSDLNLALGRMVLGLLRLNYDLFGWPASFLLLPLASRRLDSSSRLLWWMIGLSLVSLLFQRDWGIDTFGPVHAFEMALPILLLSIRGARVLGDTDQAQSVTEKHPLGHAVVLAMIVTAWVGFAPVRLRAVKQIADHVNRALKAPSEKGLHHAVVFAPFPFAPPCNGVPRHFVLFHPINDPELRNDIIWANQLSLPDERRLLRLLGHRTGFTMGWTPACDLSLVRIESDEISRE